MNPKISKALPELVENGIISETTAQQIAAYYAKNETSDTNRLFTIFGILGATLIGLGIILIMAHNWDNFSRITKVIFAFLPMVVGQAALGFNIFKNKSNTWKETATVFLFFSVGACIALLSQIYNVEGSMPTFLLSWIVLCLPLLFLTKSSAAVILQLIFITYYAFEVNTTYPKEHHFTDYVYFVLLLFPLINYYQMIKSRENSPVVHILHWLIPLSLIISLPVYIEESIGVGFLLYVTLFGILYNIGQLPYFHNKSLLQNGYRVLGSVGTVFVLTLLSFRIIWHHEFDDVVFNSFEFYLAVGMFITALVLVYRNQKHQTAQFINLFQYVFIIFAVIFSIGLSREIWPTILTNILLFVLGISAIKIGADTFHFGILNYGMLIITILIACRFFDTELSFAIRGLLFVGIGAGFFIANYTMLKRQKSKLKNS